MRAFPGTMNKPLNSFAFTLSTIRLHSPHTITSRRSCATGSSSALLASSFCAITHDSSHE